MRRRTKAPVYEYLAFLCADYQIDPNRFFEALLSAEKDGEAGCGGLMLRCRSNQRDRVMMLITKDAHVVAQFALSRSFFDAPRENPISVRLTSYLRNRREVKSSSILRSYHIRDLRHGMKKISLKAKIRSMSNPRQVYTRFGNYAMVCDAFLEDETGMIKMCLWNEGISSVTAGDAVEIEGASIVQFRGENQLKVGRKGTLTVMSKTCPALSVLKSVSSPLDHSNLP